MDTVPDPEQVVYYPLVFLNKFQPSGCPPHNLLLKAGAPILLLRKLAATPPLNTCYLYNLDNTIMKGKDNGENVFIPIIMIVQTDGHIEFKRLQYPIRQTFAMTINTFQGQTIKAVELDLTEAVFSHDQLLYVDRSRVGNPNNRSLCPTT